MYTFLKNNWLYNKIHGIKAFIKKLPVKRKYFWMTYQKNWMIDPCHDKRQIYWKKCGVNASGSFFVGADVYFDALNAHYLTIEDNVWISARSLILLHKRDLSNYFKYDNYLAQPATPLPVKICKGAAIGMGCIIMPGVTIGENAIIGTGSLVTKDVAPWTIAAGNPAKEIRKIKSRKELDLLKKENIG